MHLYILFKKFKIYIKTLKTFIHVSILRSSSENTYCPLLKLYIKTISDLLLYINFGDVAVSRVFVCALIGVRKLQKLQNERCNDKERWSCAILHKHLFN